MDRATMILKREAVIERVKRWDGIRYYSAGSDDPASLKAGDDDLHLMEAGGGSRGVDTDYEAAKRNAFVRQRPVEFRENERVAICRIWE